MSRAQQGEIQVIRYMGLCGDRATKNEPKTRVELVGPNGMAREVVDDSAYKFHESKVVEKWDALTGFPVGYYDETAVVSTTYKITPTNSEFVPLAHDIGDR